MLESPDYFFRVREIGRLRQTICEPGFLGIKIRRKYAHARKIFTISLKQKIQAALSAVKDGEAIRKAERCIVFLFTLFRII